MKLGQMISAAAAGVGLLAFGPSARAEAPGIYYSWRALETDTAQCLDRAVQALDSESLVDVRVDGNSVVGRNPEATAVFVCLDDGPASTVMVIIASNDDASAIALREALKSAF
ncbi:hypothetical protein XM38_033880 [Halomicronema hongdechloris C2206]|uniref:Uncharacterized protein n=1 Tax=Halomicronema hongdechloris C2206 TaxID=1641165 RepID=A0A1Z3HQ42_9CYAN|nr:hypothetical protein [Halomicronema hongdechloris]ASC72431.1 hypothetical protein XM38_033880 [Halomicronema hongdechloris C2206]